MRVLHERACEDIFRGAIVEMGRSSNRSEMAYQGGKQLSIDGEGWRSKLVSGTAFGCAILPKTALTAGKGNPHLAVLDIHLTQGVQGYSTERQAVEQFNPPRVHICLHHEYEL